MSAASASLDPANLRAAYADAIGRPRDAMPTPALVLDLDVARRNLATMAERLAPLPARLRPHVKVHKCPQLSLLQVEQGGAIGVATATAWEAVVMARAGVADVLVANQVVGDAKLAALAASARDARLTVAVDDARNAAALDAAARAAGSTLGALIEVDVGMGRGGTRSVPESLALAAAIEPLAALELRGVQGYEGHCMLEPDPLVRRRKAAEAMALLAEHVEAMRAAGHPIDVVSGGGTGTYDITGANPLVTELQAGSYLCMDGFHGNLVPGFERALFVAATVVIRHGSTAVVDAGRKSVGIDFVQPWIEGRDDAQATFFAEEHGLFEVAGGGLDLGERVEIVPGYAPTTVNLYDVFHVVSQGVVVDVWPVVPRGPGHGLVA
jgi:D-serine deaminase-like pyridoxal phosphate-dependent protein